MKRRRFVGMLVAGTVGLTRASAAIRMLLGFPAGASGDAFARALASGMSVALVEPVYVEDHPGAGGRMALDQIKNARPDGKSILFTPLTPLTAAPWLYKVDYDPFRDFQPLAHVATFQYVLVVGAQIPARSLGEYLTLTRMRPELCFYSASAAGGAGHMAVAALARCANVDLRFVPYKGTANALIDVLGGRLAAFMGTLGDVVDLAKQGSVRPLGIAAGERSHHVPDVPTFREQGFDVEAGGAFGVYAPARTPPPLTGKLVAGILRGLRDPTVQALADKLGLEPTGYGPADLARIQKANYEQAGTRIKASGFKIES
jgi:tripartite-type tricarboxylate transporter receptor subunit TctC